MQNNIIKSCYLCLEFAIFDDRQICIVSIQTTITIDLVSNGHLWNNNERMKGLSTMVIYGTKTVCRAC